MQATCRIEKPTIFFFQDSNALVIQSATRLHCRIPAARLPTGNIAPHPIIEEQKEETMIRIKALLLLMIPALALALTFAGAQTESAKPVTGEEIVSFLNQTVLWYRQLNVQQQLVSEPNDLLFMSDNRQTADQIVGLSFEFARTQAQALG